MMSRIILQTLFLSIGLVQVGCGDDDDKNRIKVSGISIPDVKPKVESAIPDTLNPGTSLFIIQDDSTDPGSELKSRLFKDEGPTALFAILDDLDEAMASIETRVNGFEVGPDEEPGTTSTYIPCLGDIENDEFVEKDGVAYQIKFDFNQDGDSDLNPGFTTYLNCYDDLGSESETPEENPDSEYWRAFGRADVGGEELWYIVEESNSSEDQTGTSGSAVAVSKENDYVDMWFRVGRGDQEDQTKVISHLRRDTDGIIEYTHTGTGAGYGCGLHGMISKADNLAFFVVATDQDTNSGGTDSCGDYEGDTDVEYCIDISESTFTVKDTTDDCEDAGLSPTEFDMDTLDYNLVNYENSVHALNGTVPEGVELFKGADTPEE